MGSGRVSGGVSVDMNREVKFLRKLKKIYIFVGGVGSGRGGGLRGQDGSIQRIEVFVKIQ